MPRAKGVPVSLLVVNAVNGSIIDPEQGILIEIRSGQGFSAFSAEKARLQFDYNLMNT